MLFGLNSGVFDSSFGFNYVSFFSSLISFCLTSSTLGVAEASFFYPGMNYLADFKDNFAFFGFSSSTFYWTEAGADNSAY